MNRLPPSAGKVYLVGAGPGAADLITVRGMQLLAQAEVVFHDALVEPQMLAWCPQAQTIAVGKRCGRHSCAQSFINKRLVDAAQRHAVVVRLKGGDSMMFGRADEEIAALRQAGIVVEVVPGVTAALAASASLGQSLTLRGVARSVAFCTLSQAQVEPHAQSPGPHAVPALALPEADTLAIYMGRRQAPAIGAALLAQGRPPHWPVCVVESVSTPSERRLSLTLAELAEGRAQAWMREDHPALLLLGAVFGNGQEHAEVLSDRRLCA